MSIHNMKALDTYSKEVQELMKSTSPWIQRWGITAIAVILFGVIALCYIIRLPENYTIELYPQLNCNDTIICTAYVPAEIALEIQPGQQIGNGILRSVSKSSKRDGAYLIEVAMPSADLETHTLSVPITISDQTILQKLRSSISQKRAINL